MNLSPRARSLFTVPSSSPRHRARTFFERHPCLLPIDNAAADRAAELGLAYYASRIEGKETWVQTPEGYRTYLNVPIARTGSQEYLGRELKKNRGYKPEWNLADNDLVTVWRPVDEVTSPEAIASFEQKSVLDEHPEGDKILIDALDELDGYTKGQAHNVRVGPVLESGEVSVIADLTVKHPELNLKIEGIGCAPVRDVSCGYTFIIDKDESGRYIQRKIRGNHVAVVPRGRAGSEVGIGDAAPEVDRPRSSTMSLRKMFLALGFQAWSKDQKPEAVADALAEMNADAVKDAESEAAEAKKKKDDEAAGDKGKGAKDEHPKDCDCKDCMAAKDEDLEDVDEETDKDKGAKDKKKGAKDDAEILSVEERSESDFKVGDAAANLRRMRPVIAASKDQAVRKAYNDQVRAFRQLQSGVKDGSIKDPFVALAAPSNSDAAADMEPEIPTHAFFNGKSHAEGLKDYNEYLASRQTRRA